MSGLIEAVLLVGPIEPATLTPALRRVGSPTGYLGPCPAYLAGKSGHVIVGKRYGIGVKRIGADNITSGPDIFAGYILDNIRPRQTQQVIVAAQVHMPSGKTIAAKILLRKPATLYHGAHRTVEYQYPVFHLP